MLPTTTTTASSATPTSTCHPRFPPGCARAIRPARTRISYPIPARLGRSAACTADDPAYPAARRRPPLALQTMLSSPPPPGLDVHHQHDGLEPTPPSPSVAGCPAAERPRAIRIARRGPRAAGPAPAG